MLYPGSRVFARDDNPCIFVLNMYTVHIMASTTPTKKAVKKAPAKAASAKKASTKKAPATGAFAVIATGGKQYIVRVGDVVTIEKMDGDFTAGQSVSFDQVLLTNDGTSTKVGAPTIAGAVVTASFVEEGRDKKVNVIKYKAKSRYYKKRGHRQPFMKFEITNVA